MIIKAVKKPIEIEVIQWDGLNQYDIKEKFGDDVIYEINDAAYKAGAGAPSVAMTIKTPTGIVTPEIGDYICKGYKGEIYPCKKDIFESTYFIMSSTFQEVNLTFGQALELLKEGKTLQRIGWNGKFMFISLTVNPSITDKLGEKHHNYLKIDPFIIIHTPIEGKPATYKRNTWVPSISDCLAEDWQVV